jgi:predicted metal-dependent phosphoesterase TrpH/uncharacterized membrane protein required for colicin V production
VAAYPEALRAGEARGVEVIPSMEVTTLFDGREFHVLLPFVDWEAPGVARIIERTRESRFDEARERVDLLRQAGVEVGWEEVLAATSGVAPLGVRIGQIILEKPQSLGDPLLAKYREPENKDFGPYLFYRDFFTEGKPAYVTKRHIGLVEVLDLAPGTGAAAVLSHPGAYFQRTTRNDLVALKDRGLAGVEVFTSYHTETQVAEYKRLAEELDLVRPRARTSTAGSNPTLRSGRSGTTATGWWNGCGRKGNGAWTGSISFHRRDHRDDRLGSSGLHPAAPRYRGRRRARLPLYYRGSRCLGNGHPQPLVANFLGFMVIFIATLIAGGLLGHLLTKVMKGPLALANHALGGVFGFIKAVLVCGIVVFALLVFDLAQDTLRQSWVARTTFDVTKAVVNLIPQDLRAKFNSSYEEIRKSGGSRGQKI